MHPKTRSGIKRIVLISDLHVGSTKAVLPLGFKTKEGNEIWPNAVQKWLVECWVRMQDYVESVVGKDKYVLVFNGDLIEGIHHGTKEVWSPELGDQVAACIELLTPLAKRAEKTYVVRGTECHTNNHEQTVAQQIGAEANPDADGLHSFDRLTLDLNGVRCVFRHHVSQTTRRYLGGSQLSVHLAEEQLEAANNGEQIPRVVCFGHQHKFRLYQDDNGLALICPPWQGMTRHCHKVVSQARCKPGVVILDTKGQNYGQLPQIHVKLYECPHSTSMCLN